MAELARIGIALPNELLQEFDKLITQRGYTNRSEAFRDLVRNELVNEVSGAADLEVFGTLTLVYDHHVRLLSDRLTEVQHQYYEAIMTSLHVHLDHDNCLEVILVRGKSPLVHRLANTLIATKGVKHGRLTITTSGRHLP